MRYVKFIPAQRDFVRPILQWASRCSGEFTLGEAVDAMVDYFNLSDKVRNELTAGGLNIVDNRTGRSMTQLKRAGLLQRIRERGYEITQAGMEEAFSSDERMTPAYLVNKFPAWKQSGASERQSSGIPAITSFLRPILQWASRQSGEFTLYEATEAIVDHFDISDKARSEPGRNIDKVFNRIRWSASHLNQAGLLRETGEGIYETTSDGREEAFSSNEEMTQAYLHDNFSAYRIFVMNRKNEGEGSTKQQRVEIGQVRQSFPHGRTKTVVIERRHPRKRVTSDKKPEMQTRRWTVESEPPKNKIETANKQSTAEAFKDLEVGSSRASMGGLILSTLTEEEKEARNQALPEALDRERQERQEAFERARQAAEDEHRRQLEAAENCAKMEDEHARRDAENAERRLAEAEARRRLGDVAPEWSEEDRIHACPEIQGEPEQYRIPAPPSREAIKKEHVVSSAIRYVSYDESSWTLEIEFRSGGLYRYGDVPKSLYEGLMSAGSKGRFFHTHIRGAYERLGFERSMTYSSKYIKREDSEGYSEEDMEEEESDLLDEAYEAAFTEDIWWGGEDSDPSVNTG